MENIFITHIRIDKIRNIQNLDIRLDAQERKHLIITGKNGSGKTSLINELDIFLGQIEGSAFELHHPKFDQRDDIIKRRENVSATSTVKEIEEIDEILEVLNSRLSRFGNSTIYFNKPNAITKAFRNGKFILSSFGAKRNTQHTTPTGINKVYLQKVYKIHDNAGQQFIQYIVNLKADRSFAKDDNDLKTVNDIDEWFVSFEKALVELLDTNDFTLKFDRNVYNFSIIEKNKEPYTLNQLSDGYSAILSIVTELIMRMENTNSRSYDVEGVVLIDEIETHLHIDLQKRVLPFLISFFPKIQFVVSTHSPFVISSIENAVICDLEKKIVTNDLSGYSYDTLVESYFDSDNYSQILKDKLEEYEALKMKEILNGNDKLRISDLEKYLFDIPKFLADELAVKLQQIKLKSIKSNR